MQNDEVPEHDSRLYQLREILENLKPTKLALLSEFIFVMKRLIVVLSLIMVPNYPLVQLHTYILVSFLVFTYSLAI